MNTEDQLLYQDYKFARANIQLLDAFITEIVSNKYVDVVSEDCEKAFSISQGIELNENKQQFAYIKVDIDIIDENKKTLAQIAVTCKGIFSYKGNVEKDELQHLIEMQTVPQLFPYARSAITTISSIMGIPKLTMPTIDIIKSIRMNQSR